MSSGAVFIIVVVAAFPTLILIAVAVKLWEIRKARSWLPVEAKVVTSRVQATSRTIDDTIENQPLIEYEFTLHGTKYRGNRYSIGEKATGFELEGILAKYPVGKAVTAFYDPANPKNSVIERTLPTGPMLGGLGCLMAFFIGGPLIVAAIYFGSLDWFKSHLADPKRAPFVAASGVFTLLVLLFAFGFSRTTRKAANWPVTRGKILRSEVEQYLNTKDGVSRTMYRPCVEYGYTVNGREFRGDQTVLGVSVSSTSEGMARRAAAKYPRGKVVYVHYNPEAPGESVVNPYSKWHYLPWVVAAVMATLTWAVATGRM